MKEQIKETLAEFHLQKFWIQSTFPQDGLVTEDNKKITFIDRGLYNTDKGPDFFNAKLLIEEKECIGSVEVHTDENDWFYHKHHLDKQYNNVILHFYLKKGKQRAKNEIGMEIPSFQLPLSLQKDFYDSLQQTLLKKNTIGSCGLATISRQPTEIKQIVLRAAEDRLSLKAEVFADCKTIEDYEQQLYQKIFRALGYTNWAALFETLAQKFPYKNTFSIIKTSSYRDALITTLKEWFGWLGLFEQEETFLQNSSLNIRREYYQMKEQWKTEKRATHYKQKVFSHTSSRPQNDPLRRLLGMFTFLVSHTPTGIFMSCFQLFEEQEITEKTVKKIFKKFDNFFFMKDTQFLYDTNTQNGIKESRLIGKERTLIIFINAILPVFYAYAKQENNPLLMKKLFQFFLLLRNESTNTLIKIMELRLGLDETKIFNTKKLYYGQGLLHINKICCTSYYQGCRNCTFLNSFSQIKNDD